MGLSVCLSLNPGACGGLGTSAQCDLSRLHSFPLEKSWSVRRRKKRDTLREKHEHRAFLSVKIGVRISTGHKRPWKLDGEHLPCGVGRVFTCVLPSLPLFFSFFFSVLLCFLFVCFLASWVDKATIWLLNTILSQPGKMLRLTLLFYSETVAKSRIRFSSTSGLRCSASRNFSFYNSLFLLPVFFSA